MKENKNVKELSTKGRIADLRKQTEKLERMMRASCSHHNKKGLYLDPTGEAEGEYMCRECGEKFSIAPITAANLGVALETVHNAVQQIRAYADNTNDAEVIKLLGELDYSMTNLVGPMYKQVILNFKGGKKKKKNKNKRKSDSFGGYGSYQSFRR